MRRRLIITCILLVVGAAGIGIWSGGFDVKSDRSSVTLGDLKLSIDNQYIESNPWLRVFDRVPGLDDSRQSIGLAFSRQQLVDMGAADSKIVHNGLGDDVIHGDLSYVDDEQSAHRMSPRRASDFWFGTESFKGRIIEPDPTSEFFKVFRKIEHPYSWEVARIDPDSNPQALEDAKTVHDVWIGHCLRFTTGGVSCRSFITVENLIYAFYFDGDLVPDFDAWARALEEKIESWIVEG